MPTILRGITLCLTLDGLHKQDRYSGPIDIYFGAFTDVIDWYFNAGIGTNWNSNSFKPGRQINSFAQSITAPTRRNQSKPNMKCVKDCIPITSRFSLPLAVFSIRRAGLTSLPPALSILASLYPFGNSTDVWDVVSLVSFVQCFPLATAQLDCTNLASYSLDIYKLLRVVCEDDRALYLF
ncbi:hypothetical protein Pelo_17353 [Pelomyxa schiedti]|nr:hypothetical protein Pelo_17353 [Pelomyxa schiedti]